MRRLIKWSIWLSLSYLALSIVAALVLLQFTIHLPRSRNRDATRMLEIASSYGAQLQDVSIRVPERISARDLTLRAWYLQPKSWNGNAVILLHGQADSRYGVGEYSNFLMKSGYSVLVPDARAHGDSDGEIVTYGALERYDLAAWVRWLKKRTPSCVYGFGSSMGAAILLQALGPNDGFCAVVSDSAFSSFREIGYDRVSQMAHMPGWFGRIFGRLAIAIAFSMARMKYGIDFSQVSPIESATNTCDPILLIHGGNDTAILPRHAYLLATVANGHVQLWVEEHAGHLGAVSSNPGLFQSRIINFLREYRQRCESVK